MIDEALEIYDSFIPDKNRQYDEYYEEMVSFKDTLLNAVEKLDLLRDVTDLNYDEELVSSIKIDFMNKLKPLMENITDYVNDMKDGIKLNFNMQAEINRQGLKARVEDIFNNLAIGNDTFSTLSPPNQELPQL